MNSVFLQRAKENNEAPFTQAGEMEELVQPQADGISPQKCILENDDAEPKAPSEVPLNSRIRVVMKGLQPKPHFTGSPAPSAQC